MTDADDKLKRAYRELARDEPPAALDAAVLARARTRTAAKSRFARFAGPVSIAAVLVLGIGVSLRMQLEQPGVETSAPAAQSEYPVPQSTDSAASAPAAKEEVTAQPQAQVPAQPPARADLNRVAPQKPIGPPPQTRALPDERFVASPPATPPPAASAPPPAALSAPASAPAPGAVQLPPAEAQNAPSIAGATATQQASPAPMGAPRAKRESAAMDSLGTRELRKSLRAEAEADPQRELERIARLRESGDHAAADKALEEFRKRHPDFRIPEAVWERVRPR